MVLSRLSVPGWPTNLDNNRARAYWACSRRGGVWILFLSSVFLSSFSLLSPSLGLM